MARAAAPTPPDQIELPFDTTPAIELPPGAQWRETLIAQQRVGFALLRSRRKTIGFLIGDDGLRVTAPRWVTLAQIDAALQEKSRWILSRLRTRQERRERLALAPARWQDGGEVPYLGRRLTLRLDHSRHTGLDGDLTAPADGDLLILALPPDAESTRIRDAVQSWLQARARELIGTRLQAFLTRTGLRITRWRLSSAATRWGSCSASGNIMLNWRLVHFPPSVIDYVIAHELAHLREMNHSPRFWAQVENLLPGFEAARDTLRRTDPAELPKFD